MRRQADYPLLAAYSDKLSHFRRTGGIRGAGLVNGRSRHELALLTETLSANRSPCRYGMSPGLDRVCRLLVEPSEGVDEEGQGCLVCEDRERESGPEFDLCDGQVHAGNLVKPLTELHP